MVSKSLVAFSVLASLVAVCVSAPAAEYKIDPAHSSSTFKVNHLGASNVYGMIPNVSGTVRFDANNATQNAVDISVKTASLSTFNSARDQHLSGPDFFNAKQFPTLTFKSTSWKTLGGNKYEVTGDFTMLGVTKQMTVIVTHVGIGKNRRGQTLAGFESTFTIDRTDFGMNYGVAETGGLGKEVTLTISIEAQEQ